VEEPMGREEAVRAWTTAAWVSSCQGERGGGGRDKHEV